MRFGHDVEGVGDVQIFAEPLLLGPALVKKMQDDHPFFRMVMEALYLAWSVFYIVWSAFLQYGPSFTLYGPSFTMYGPSF